MPDTDTEEERLKEATQSVDATTADLDEKGEQLGESIEQAKRHQEETMADEKVPTSAGDWEETEPDDEAGGDAGGFDDPENLDLDDEDLSDDDPDEEET
jgi:hypothetical protein